MCQQRNCVSPKQANRAASYIDGLHARCVGPLPGSIKRLIDALDVPLPNGPLDIRQRALAQADLVEPIERAGENLLRWAVFWIRSRLPEVQTLSGRGRSGMSRLHTR